MRKVKYISLTLLIAIAIFALVITILVSVYDNQVKEYIIKKLPADITYNECNLTFWKSFPDIAIELTNVSVKDSYKIKKESSDTLLYGKQLFLKFDAINIINEDYVINDILLKNGFINVKIDKFGNENYYFADEESNDSTSLDFSLQNLELINTKVKYSNNKIDNYYSAQSDNITLSGDFASNVYNLAINGDLFIDSVYIKKINYAKDIDSKVNLDLNIDNNNNNYSVKSQELILSGLPFDLIGDVYLESEKRDKDSLNIFLSGKDIEMSDLKDIIPEKYQGSIDDYYSKKGNVIFEAKISGEFSNNVCPSVKANFKVTDAELYEENSSMVFENINFKGTYDNNSSFYSKNHIIELQNFSAKLGNGNISGVLVYKNFVSPEINCSLDANLSLFEINEFFTIDTIEDISGQLILKGEFEGVFKDLENISANDFLKAKTSGEFSVKNLNLELKKDPFEYKDINGEFDLDNNNIAINSLTGKYGVSDFELMGKFKNFLPFLFLENETIGIKANLTSEYINLDEIIAERLEYQTGDNSGLSISDKYNANINITAKKIKYKKLNTENLTGNLKVNNQSIIATDIIFNSLEGKIKLNGKIFDKNNSTLGVQCNALCDKINITEMFYRLDNFGQNYLTQDNIKGIGNAKISFKSVLTTNLDDFLNNLYGTIDLSIRKGELIEFETLYSLADYVKIEELKHIKFSTLTSYITVKDRIIYFPQTDIKSSAMDLNIKGQHTFDNDIDYNVKMHFSELLSQKIKKSKKENSEFMVMDDEESKPSLYLKIYGNVDNPQYKYDKKTLKNTIKQDIQKEKDLLRGLFQDEGLIDKDNTNDKGKDKVQEKQFEYGDFDED